MFRAVFDAIAAHLKQRGQTTFSRRLS